MNFKKIITLLLSVLLLLSTFVGCRNVADDTSSDLIESSNTVYGNVDIVDDGNTEENIDDASQTDNNSSQTESGDNSSVTSTDSSTTVSEPNTNTNPDGKEIYGTGTADDPYIDFPDADNHTVKTLSIPAGKSVFYSISRVGGRILTINDASAFVVCDGTKHTAKNGVLSFKVVDALASDAITFEIGNTGSTNKNYTITFTDIEGSMSNPTIIKNINEKFAINLEEGNEIGHFYKHIATQNGTLKFYLLSGTEKGILIATNNRNSAQRSTESTDEGEVKTDDNGTYIELEVQKDDEIIIHVGSKQNKRGKYPATTIEWTAKY